MTWWGVWWGDSGGSSAPPVILTNNVTTPGAIRDRIIALIEALTPVSSPTGAPGNRFRHFLNEGDADFVEWCQDNPNSAFRRFQVRDKGPDVLGDVCNTDVESRLVTFRVLVAYPQTARTGKANALARDDVMLTDQRQIENAIGVTGYTNFPDASWTSGTANPRTVGKSIDFLELEQTYRFYRRMIP